jgi:hypothetical protein
MRISSNFWSACPDGKLTLGVLMNRDPSVVVFDVNETLSDMSPMARRFADVGAPEHLAKLWFATLLRDGFALTAAGGQRPFAEKRASRAGQCVRPRLGARGPVTSRSCPQRIARGPFRLPRDRSSAGRIARRDQDVGPPHFQPLPGRPPQCRHVAEQRGSCGVIRSGALDLAVRSVHLGCNTDNVPNPGGGR